MILLPVFILLLQEDLLRGIVRSDDLGTSKTNAALKNSFNVARNLLDLRHNFTGKTEEKEVSIWSCFTSSDKDNYLLQLSKRITGLQMLGQKINLLLPKEGKSVGDSWEQSDEEAD